MSKNNIVLTLGILLIIVPFLGFPIRFDNIFTVVSGVILILVAFKRPVKRHVFRRRRKQASSTDTYTESPIPQSSVTTVQATETPPHEYPEKTEILPG